MEKTMKAAVVREFGQPLVIEELPVPVPGPGELLVEVIACGVCHTDLHAAEGDWPVKPAPPFVPGHETAGRVVALGEGVANYKIGDAVGIAWLHDACGMCEYCITGWETLCEEQRNSGYSIDGGFAQIRANVVTVLTPKAQKAEDIDAGAATRALEAAHGATTTPEAQEAQRKAQTRARAQLRIAQKVHEGHGHGAAASH